MSGFQFFDRCYVISLPDIERREKIAEELARVGITRYEFIWAEPPSRDYQANNFRRNARAELGVSLSHIKAIVRALDDRVARPLFLEDDVEFIGELPCIPPMYDVYFLGGHPRSPVKPMGLGVVRVGTFSFAEAYSVHGRSLRSFFEFWCDRVGQPNAMFDFALGEFAAKNGGFACDPPVTRQREVVSHVSGTVDRKAHLVEKGWANNRA